MTIEPELLMAFADGALDPITAKRVERAIAGDPSLAAQVERHRALRTRVASSFAPIADEPVPDRLVAMLRSNVAPMAVRPARARPPWRAFAAMAACLVLGLILGPVLNREQVSSNGKNLYAAGALADALGNQQAGAAGEVRIAVSFRDGEGSYCRVFSAPVADGIACRDRHGWALRRTMPGSRAAMSGDYAQAASANPELMAVAQDMMVGRPLDPAGETSARATGWTPAR